MNNKNILVPIQHQNWRWGRVSIDGDGRKNVLLLLQLHGSTTGLELSLGFSTFHYPLIVFFRGVSIHTQFGLEATDWLQKICPCFFFFPPPRKLSSILKQVASQHKYYTFTTQQTNKRTLKAFLPFVVLKVSIYCVHFWYSASVSIVSDQQSNDND